jgi:translation initiation factor SUI1
MIKFWYNNIIILLQKHRKYKINKSINIEDFNEPGNFDSIKIHIWLKQRSARSHITTIEGLPSSDLNIILKNLKKQLCCNGCIKDGINGKYLQLSGDHRYVIINIFVEYDICDEENIIVHGI